jgi:hypothetical protein
MKAIPPILFTAAAQVVCSGRVLPVADFTSTDKKIATPFIVTQPIRSADPF